MQRTNFESLRVYRLAEELGDKIWQIVVKRRGLARDTVGPQLVRSADGIGANVAEGSGRGTVTDNRRFVLMARGSLYETKHWLRRAYQRQILTSDEVTELKTLVDALTQVLKGYLRSLNARRKRSE
jgi:four helix bundle protein